MQYRLASGRYIAAGLRASFRADRYLIPDCVDLTRECRARHGHLLVDLFSARGAIAVVR